MMDDQIKTIRTARKAPDSANAEPLRKDSAPAIDANATELPRHDFQRRPADGKSARWRRYLLWTRVDG